MAKDKLQKNRNIRPDKKVKTSQGNDLLGILDNFFDKGNSWLVWVYMAVTLLISLLLYDPKVSLSGDDSFYIIRASEFIHSFQYPSFQGPLYPMVLGLVVAVFGISLTPLKVVSLLAMLGSVYLTFRMFRQRIPATLLNGMMILVSVNAYLLYYSSQTYSEAFYIFIQALLMMFFFSRFIKEESGLSLKANFLRHLLLAILLLAVTLTKNIGYSALIAVGGYFILRGQWKNLAFFVICFAGVFLAFQGLKMALWNVSDLQFSNQGSGLLNKDYYNPQEGREDFAGMIKRFSDNSNLYLSKHLMYFLGFRTFSITMAVIPWITVFIYLLAITGLVLTYRKNAYLFFSGLMGGAFLLVTFIVLQAKWDQSRLIIPVFSLIILLLASAIYYLGRIKKLKFIQFILPVLILILFFRILGATTLQIQEARKEKGRFGGLTPDWKNYLKASEWAAANLPEDAVIACRKPSVSFIYGGGREFYGIMQVPTFSAEDFFEKWKTNPDSLVAFTYKDFETVPVNPMIYQVLKQQLLAQYFAGDQVFFIDYLPDTVRPAVLGELRKYGVREFRNPDSLMNLTRPGNRAATLVYPDSLVDNLIQNKVSYVLTANIRRNSMVKNGQIVNTVERFIAFIEDKYPGFTSKVNQIGADENEPASILKLNYDKTGRKVDFESGLRTR